MNCVFEGGGVLGISFVGAYKALMDYKKYEIVRCAGTSAGSIIASLIIAGYKSNEIINILENCNFKIFMNTTKLSKIFLAGKPLSLMFNNGIYNSKVIETWMEELLLKKGIRTFQDLMENNISRLKIIAADITTRKMLILPDDLINYGIDPKSFSVAKAVRMSCTIPYFFTPVKLNYNNKVSYIVDGGLLSTFPIWIFDVEKESIRPTLGFKIKDKCSQTSLGKHSIFSYTLDLINAQINKDEMDYVRDKDLVRTIIINNNGKIKSTDFKLSNKMIDYLFQSGYDSTSSFLLKWDFIQYAKLFLV